MISSKFASAADCASWQRAVVVTDVISFDLQACTQGIREVVAKTWSGGVGGFAFLALAPWPAQGAEFKLVEPTVIASVAHFDRFVAADAFKLGRQIGGRTLSAVGLNFAAHFIGMVENNVPATSLQVWSLQLAMGDTSLISRLGGQERVAVPFVAYIYRLMEMGEGASHTDGRSNFAYVRSPVDRRLWAIHWSVNFANEWTIGAVYVPHPQLDWRADSYVLTRSHQIN
jgi:hypothetical protein